MRPYCRLRCRCADTAVLCAQGRAACQLQLVRCALLPRVRLYQPICMHTVCRLYSLQCPLLSTLRMCVPRSLQTRAAPLAHADQSRQGRHSVNAQHWLHAWLHPDPCRVQSPPTPSMTVPCLMQARGADTTLPTLISAGAEDIAAGQAKVVALLQSIIGQQNSAAAAAEDAAEALAAIQNLQSQQAAAQQAIALSLTNSISAIQVGSTCVALIWTWSTSWR